MNNAGTAYVLWLGCLLQLHGLHRLYNGKILTGLIWLFSFGLFGVGQVIDLLLIPNMVEEHNDRLRSRQGSMLRATHSQPAIERVVDVQPLTGAESALAKQVTVAQPVSSYLIADLLKAAEIRGGKLSVTHGVIETGASFTEVEAALMEIVRSGYADISNHPETGVVMYEFREL